MNHQMSSLRAGGGGDTLFLSRLLKASNTIAPPPRANFLLALLFAGTIPPDLGNLAALRFLSVQGNQLSGGSLVALLIFSMVNFLG